MIKFLLTSFIVLVFFNTGNGQTIALLDTGHAASLRGMSVLTDNIIWVSGSKGSVGLSTNGGLIWKWVTVKGYETSDFRDVEAFSATDAVIMGITEPAVVLRTTDAGDHWALVFTDTAKTAFLDAMDFSGAKGMVVGDPIGSTIFIGETDDYGKKWKRLFPSGLQSTDSGEAFFASSGSNIVLKNNKPVVVSGGLKSAVYFSSNKYSLLINQGTATSGANAIAINPADSNTGFVVGGDFSHDSLRYRNGILIQFIPFTQTTPQESPHGYRSSVSYLDEKRMITCGTSGVDFSSDGGTNWRLISPLGFHVCKKAKTGTAVFLAGPKGRIARLQTLP